MEVVCGTYEELVLACKLNGVTNEFETSFTDHSHTGNVKAVAVSKNGLLSTGSSDESIKVFNLVSRKESGTLIHHTGSITALEFFERSFLFSASEDGTIGIWKTGAWECQRILRGHKGAVYDISIHPSGKLLLSVSTDKCMKTWNLITGKCAYTTNLKAAADHIKWLPKGDRYAVVVDRKLDIYAVQTGVSEGSVQYGKRIHCVEFLNDDIMVLAGESGSVTLYNSKDCSLLYEFPTETIRVKGLHCCTCPDSSESYQVTTGSADGHIKLWNLVQGKDGWSHTLQTSIDMKFRITSMAVRMEIPKKEKTKKRKSVQAADENISDLSSGSFEKEKKQRKLIEHEESASEVVREDNVGKQNLSDTETKDDKQKKPVPISTKKSPKKKKVPTATLR